MRLRAVGSVVAVDRLRVGDDAPEAEPLPARTRTLLDTVSYDFSELSLTPPS